MAIENAKKLNVRIRNKYDSYESWMASGLVLEAGEIAIAHTTVDVQVDNGTVKQPALLMKVGDGAKTFANLPWLSAKAADVLSVCKSEADLKAFVNGVIADAGIASDDAMQALAGRVTTAESAITALQAALGENGSVAQQIESAIEELNLAGTYAAKEHTHTKAEITDFAHGHVMADVEGLVDALAGKQAAGDYAAEVHTHVMADVTDLANELAKYQLKGDFAAEEHGHVIADVEGLQDALDAKAVKADVNAKIEALEAEDLRIAGLVATEEARAKGIEGGLETRLAAVEGDYLKAADKTELQGNIDSLTDVVEALRDGIDADKVDGIIDLVNYVEEHGAEVTEMKNGIAANKKAIEDHAALDHDFAAADATLKSELEGQVALKADASVVTKLESDLDARLVVLEAIDHDAYKGADEVLSGRLDILEAIDHEAYKGADAALKTELEGTMDSKIAALDLANTYEAKGTAEGFNTAMNARVEALEAIDHDHANKAELDLIASGDKAKWDAAESNAKTHADNLNTAMDARVAALEALKFILEGDEVVLDCGDSKVNA